MMTTFFNLVTEDLNFVWIIGAMGYIKDPIISDDSTLWIMLIVSVLQLGVRFKIHLLVTTDISQSPIGVNGPVVIHTVVIRFGIFMIINEVERVMVDI